MVNKNYELPVTNDHCNTVDISRDETDIKDYIGDLSCTSFKQKKTAKRIKDIDEKV